MKGSVFKRGSTWAYVVDLPRGEDGKRKQKKKGGFATKKEAEAALAKFIADVERGMYVEDAKITLGEYLEEWLKDKQANVRKSTFRSYAWLVNNHIIPHIGQIELTKLTPVHLQRLYTKLQQQEQPLSNRSILHAHLIIQEALDRALKWGMVARNVAKAIDPPRPKKVDFQVWNEEEVKRFLEVAKDDRYYVAFLLAITTGMRKGEILGLRWQDVDLEKGIISVRQTLSYTGKGSEFQAPKTDHGKRAIAIPPQVVEFLRKHKVKQAEEKLLAGPLYQDHDLVVATQVGTPVTARNLDRSWYKLRDEADVPKIRFHDLRHTHASLMLLQGIHPKVVSERLGHANIGITLDTYSHVLPGLQEAAATQFGEVLFGEKKVKKTVDKSSV
ncbi:site-specific integrase [Collibacillus ludicampi]|uniref:Site-specific integrase n=1 Tax=Collibacillus ludicampi TaxID=2771369 RepID=A0AAV4LDT2_9BACL|nr:site-specific integrase [Collibacillus ludicampi]GIM45915.1 site-specific integrase [Collibacillus ludicampi]